MNWKKVGFSLIIIGIPVVLLAQSIKWYNDAAIPHKTAPVDGDILSLQQTGPNAYRWVYASDLKRYVGASNVTIITTNYAVYGTNYYYNDTYVSNFFETNILNNTVVSNYFFDFIYYTNTYQTNVTIEQYVSYNSFVSNTVISNVYNDTYTSNYFTTNVFPTTYVYTTNTIGGAFIANLNGIGTNLTVREGLSLQGDGSAPGSFDLYDAMGSYIIAGFDGTEFFGNGGGLTNLPSTSSAQVWTNDGSLIFIPLATNDNGAPLFAINPTNGIPWIGNATDVTGSDKSSFLFARNYFNSNAAFTLFTFDSASDASFGNYEATITGSAAFTDGGGANGNTRTVLSLYSQDPYGTWAYVDISPVSTGIGDFITVKTNSTVTFSVNGRGSVMSKGIYYGDGSGLTNLNVTATTNLTVYETINVKNLNVTSNIYYLNAKATNVTWVGPTNTVDFSLGTVQSYVTADPISITNVIGEMAAYQNSTILCISNSSANVITNTLTATGWKLGRFDTLVCTNAGVIQIWLQNIGGMKTVAVREYP